MDTNAKKTFFFIALALVLFFSAALLDAFRGASVVIPALDIVAGWYAGNFWRKLANSNR